VSGPQPTQAEIVRAIEAVTRMTDALQLDGDVAQNEAVNEDYDAVRKVLDWAQGEVAVEPATVIQVKRLRLNGRVRVTADGTKLRTMMAHHLGREGKVVAFSGGPMGGGMHVDVHLDHIGVVTFMDRELEPEG